MNGGPSGFHNAPLTRMFCVACGTFTVLFGFLGRSYKHGLSYQDVFGKQLIWKIISAVFFFSSTPELMFGLYLLYYFRVFERQIGSNKYSVFVLFSVVTSLLLEILALILLKGSAASSLVPGPYGLIFASFVPFFFDIPVSTWFRVFSIRLSDKSFIYLAGLQLLLSSWRRSIIPGVCGILSGCLYRVNLFGIRKAKFPKFITSIFTQFSWPSGGNWRSSSGEAAPSAPSYSHLPPSRISSSSPEMSGDNTATLESMGFDRSSIRNALMRTGNDINAATNLLLDDQSH